MTQIGYFSLVISAWEIARSHTVPCQVSREADKQVECCVWQGNLESNGPNWLVRYDDATANFSLPTDLPLTPHSITKMVKDLLVVLLCDVLALWCIVMMHNTTGVKENSQLDLDIAADLSCFFLALGMSKCCHYDCIFVSGSYP